MGLVGKLESLYDKVPGKVLQNEHLGFFLSGLTFVCLHLYDNEDNTNPITYTKEGYYRDNIVNRKLHSLCSKLVSKYSDNGCNYKYCSNDSLLTAFAESDFSNDNSKRYSIIDIESRVVYTLDVLEEVFGTSDDCFLEFIRAIIRLHKIDYNQEFAVSDLLSITKILRVYDIRLQWCEITTSQIEDGDDNGVHAVSRIEIGESRELFYKMIRELLLEFYQKFNFIVYKHYTRANKSKYIYHKVKEIEGCFIGYSNAEEYFRDVTKDNHNWAGFSYSMTYGIWAEKVKYHYMENRTELYLLEARLIDGLRFKLQSSGMQSFNHFERHTLCQLTKDYEEKIQGDALKVFNNFFGHKNFSKIAYSLVNCFQEPDIKRFYYKNNKYSYDIQSISEMSSLEREIKIFVDSLRSDEVLNDSGLRHNDFIFRAQKLLKKFVELVDKDQKGISQYSPDLVPNVEKIIDRLSSSELPVKDENPVIYQSDFSDCLIPVSIVDFSCHVVVYSSFVVPYSSELVWKFETEPLIARARGKLYALSSLKVFEQKVKSAKTNLERTVNKANEEIRTMAEKKIQEASSRNIEILSVFSAIALFSLGAVQTFTRDITASQAALYLCAFGAGLCCFVALIIGLFRVNQANSLNWRNDKVLILSLVSPLLLFVVVGCIALTSGGDFRREINEYRDSVSTYQIKLHEREGVLSKQSQVIKENEVKLQQLERKLDSLSKGK